MSSVTTTPQTAIETAIETTAGAIDRHLLATVGTEPGQATPVDMMHAIAQVARERCIARERCSAVR
jgi:hypothetical protein